jgi:hypothetical protein
MSAKAGSTGIRPEDIDVKQTHNPDRCGHRSEFTQAGGCAERQLGMHQPTL